MRVSHIVSPIAFFLMFHLFSDTISFVGLFCRSLLSLIGLFVYVYIYVSYANFFICVLCDFFFHMCLMRIFFRYHRFSCAILKTIMGNMVYNMVYVEDKKKENNVKTNTTYVVERARESERGGKKDKEKNY
jgi:predicted membrane protein